MRAYFDMEGELFLVSFWVCFEKLRTVAMLLWERYPRTLTCLQLFKTL